MSTVKVEKALFDKVVQYFDESDPQYHDASLESDIKELLSDKLRRMMIHDLNQMDRPRRTFL